MIIALCSDEVYPVHARIERELSARGHRIQKFGALDAGRESPWAACAEAAALAVVRGQCDEGIFCCWSGTGICMAANKVRGIRAALCTDPGTARAARRWNHANVLCLSNRLLSEDMSAEILEAWFEDYATEVGVAGVRELLAVEARHVKAEPQSPPGTR
ncbi:MAG TPA: RpiB/LacA/LacB family sugar-phosphate isomerase [Polyangiaceae bacterium]|nr:RpiB/LacA/LacB family sugar-phosphate isomerase [Polyangiaceae bacterium]